MSNYQVYQLNFRNAPETFANITFRPSAELIANARKHYQKVAVIDAVSFDDVFAISNLGEEEHLITRLAPMHSVSVGDVIIDEAGNSVYVDTFGFTSFFFEKIQFN